MSGLPEFTVVLALDAKTIEQLKVSIWTWYLNSPILWEMPWLISYDFGQISEQDIADLFVMRNTDGMERPWGGVRLRPWQENESYANQREKMLTSFVFAAERVETDWWIKIDTDAICMAKQDWIDPVWFRAIGGPPEPYDHAKNTARYNAWISNPWPYTKPANQMEKLDDWADEHKYPPGNRLNIPYDVGARRCGHPRMASWLSFYNTAWTAEIACELRTIYNGEPRMPVPSQDGFHFFMGERMRMRTQKVRFKKLGWGNHSKLQNLKTAAEEALK